MYNNNNNNNNNFIEKLITRLYYRNEKNIYT